MLTCALMRCWGVTSSAAMMADSIDIVAWIIGGVSPKVPGLKIALVLVPEEVACSPLSPPCADACLR